MKKIIISMLAVLGTVAMVSCEQEKSFNDKTLGENALVLSLQGAPATRSAEDGAIIQKGATIPFELGDNGDKFILEETIQDLNGTWAPATKGTPVYTENVGVLYEKMGVRAGGSNYEFYSMDNAEGSATGSMTDGGWRYQGEFTWAQDAYDFYFWMPTTDNGITGTPTYGKTDNDLSITFSYESKTTAADQKDLIFAARNITKADAQGQYRVKGVPVLFNHVLTGVKFAIANYDSDKNISIKSVSFKGLVGSASCVVTPAVEDNYKDNRTNYTSGTAAVVNWTIPTNPDRSKTYSSGAYADTVYYAPNGSFQNNGKYPSSFSDGGNKHNLNDADATQTFWLIPQTMSEDVTLTITYTYGGKTKTGEFAFGKLLDGVIWKAGELRTYTINVTDVDVTITDKFITSEKNTVEIKNTGNTDAFIRAAIIGQWVDDKGQPVFGYTNYKDGLPAPVEIKSWQEDFESNGGYFGSFTGLASSGSNWVRGEDGYFYYTVAVAPGKIIGTAPANASNAADYLGNPLFTKYTVVTNHAPTMKVGGQTVPTTLLIDVAVQAISAKKPDGTYYDSYTDAWANAKTIAGLADAVEN